MAVDYTPSFDPADVDSDYGSTGGDITVPTFTANMKPFRFWCQRALPLVYDDSLSYYEVLCKVVDQMNGFLTDLQTATGSITEFAQQFVVNQQFINDMAEKLGQDVDTLETYINDRMEDFTTAYEQLQSYVNNYFDNLDVQVEINNKLDAMAQDGTLNTLFDPVLQTWMEEKTAQIDAAIANQDDIQAQQNGRISVLESRMDGFSSLPSGSTSGNAELLDIRTNFLGERYPSAGDAVRTSDMIASGFQSIGFTRLTDWNGNAESSVYDTIVFDVAAYKGGHVVVIANMDNFVSDIEAAGGIGLFGSNIAGKTVDSNAEQYPFPDGYSGFSDPVFKNYSIIPTSITGEERVLIQLSIPNDFPFQYLKLGNVESIQGTYTTPAAIVYATSWSKTPVDDTLTIAGDAADAKATGDRKVSGIGEYYTPNDIIVVQPSAYYGAVGSTPTQNTSLSNSMSIRHSVAGISKVKISGYGWQLAYNYSLYFFLDSNGKIISRYEVDSANVTDLEVDVPNGAVEIIVNGRSDRTTAALKLYMYDNTFSGCLEKTIEPHLEPIQTELSRKVNGVIGFYTPTDIVIEQPSIYYGSIGSTPTEVTTQSTGMSIRHSVADITKVKISGYGWQLAYNYSLYFFLDSTGKIISRYEVDSANVSDLEVNVPNGAAEIIVNGKSDRTAPGLQFYGYITDFNSCLEAITGNTNRIKLIALGDSITALGTTDRGWLKYFSEKIPCEIIANTAVNSAVLADYADTVYDGNPSQSLQSNNVLGNQVQKIINSNYETPDLIIIAIGTNGGINISQADMSNVYYENNTLIPLTDVDRTTDAGAFRYAFDTLHELYPNAIIVWCTPIMGCQTIRPVSNIITYAESLRIATEYIGQMYIDTIRCGINGINEIRGANGEYLIDGLHPNTKGAKKIGYYNASKIQPIIDKMLMN